MNTKKIESFDTSRRITSGVPSTNISSAVRKLPTTEERNKKNWPDSVNHFQRLATVEREAETGSNKTLVSPAHTPLQAGKLS